MAGVSLMKLDGKKPTLAEMFDVAEERAKPDTESDGRRHKPEWKFKVRPMGGLKPHGLKLSGEMKL